MFHAVNNNNKTQHEARTLQNHVLDRLTCFNEESPQVPWHVPQGALGATGAQFKPTI
jgi:hypothetical protein